jgi:hypothetical protein
MLYKEDYKYSEAKKLIESLSNDNDRDVLIMYYISKQKEIILKRDKKIAEYQEVFNLMGKFLPNNGKSTVYGG